MHWLGNIFVSIAAFFGFGSQASVPPEPTPMAIEEQMSAEMSDEIGTSSAIAGAVSEETDPASITESDSMSDDSGVHAMSPATSGQNMQTMLVAGGCFWCVEADLEKVHGVIRVVSGYAGGTTENPTYENYGKGGHREVVEVTYDANQVSYEDILIVAMKTTDPTDDDGTFHDRGDKYSSAFYYENNAQKQIIDTLIAEVNQYGPYDKSLAIDVEPRPTFWPAEDYHQDYYKGTLSQLKYKYYRNASGRDDFIKKYWGVNDHSPQLPWRENQSTTSSDTTTTTQSNFWTMYSKPSKDELKASLDPLAYKVTQEEGTERAGTSPLDKNYEPGIYVDILSGEPLYSSKDKFDSGTGWPSFTKPITPTAVTEHEDRKLFATRTEIRSAIADNHLGHVFTDGPKDSTGLRYCMNGAALEFIPKDQMEARGYGEYLDKV